MADPIFEHYKEALKAGHVAVLRGRLDEALAHYREAAAIADERPLPHTSLGGVLLRLGRVDEALAAYARALGRAPKDEGALAGRADALVLAGRRSEAAEVLERLADVQAASEREPEAAETLRRALEYGDTKRRRRRYQALAHAVRATAARTGEVSEAPQPGAVPAADADRAAAAAGTAPGEADSSGAPAREAEPAEAGAGEAAEAPTGEAAPGAPLPAEVAEAAAGEQATPPPDPEGALRDALAAAGEGRTAEAVASFLDAARQYASLGASEAALDACERALGVAPGDATLHLMLARLYLARGWRDKAGDKLLLLDRLLAFGDPADQRATVLAFARDAFPGDARFDPVGPG